MTKTKFEQIGHDLILTRGQAAREAAPADEKHWAKRAKDAKAKWTSQARRMAVAAVERAGSSRVAHLDDKFFAAAGTTKYKAKRALEFLQANPVGAPLITQINTTASGLRTAQLRPVPGDGAWATYHRAIATAQLPFWHKHAILTIRTRYVGCGRFILNRGGREWQNALPNCAPGKRKKQQRLYAAEFIKLAEQAGVIYDVKDGRPGTCALRDDDHQAVTKLVELTQSLPAGSVHRRELPGGDGATKQPAQPNVQTDVSAVNESTVAGPVDDTRPLLRPPQGVAPSPPDTLLRPPRVLPRPPRVLLRPPQQHADTADTGRRLRKTPSSKTPPAGGAGLRQRIAGFQPVFRPR
ncbi:hypothetical protein [Paludisphaera borealis]|uniref:Uncharacterized protein n=1 Tax=Paludisphaera borealis TaxID=1387353 RepID=A0A1U7CXA7_9BACT|nr:hypothetical protein [Paludisphaera borealis]APW63513.1 hypothetical protein BSF38_05085 [Paludisphaera borealis]